MRSQRPLSDDLSRAFDFILKKMATRRKLTSREQREEFLMRFSSTENEIDLNVVDCERRSKFHVTGSAREVLERWMFDHRFYCYPTKAEKIRLAQQTNLSVQKITNWFINSRRRILPKLLAQEGINPVNFTITRKKKMDEEMNAHRMTECDNQMMVFNGDFLHEKREEKKIDLLQQKDLEMTIGVLIDLVTKRNYYYIICTAPKTSN